MMATTDAKCPTVESNDLMSQISAPVSCGTPTITRFLRWKRFPTWSVRQSDHDHISLASNISLPEGTLHVYDILGNVILSTTLASESEKNTFVLQAPNGRYIAN